MLKKFYTISVQVGVGNTSDEGLLAVYADFNGDGDFTDSGENLESVSPGNGKKNGDIHMLTFTTPAAGGAASTSQRIRLRIISDYDNGVDPISSTI